MAITRYARTAPVVHDIAPALTATPRERIRGSSTPYLHTTAGDAPYDVSLVEVVLDF